MSASLHPITSRYVPCVCFVDKRDDSCALTDTCHASLHRFILNRAPFLLKYIRILIDRFHSGPSDYKNSKKGGKPCLSIHTCGPAQFMDAYPPLEMTHSTFMESVNSVFKNQILPALKNITDPVYFFKRLRTLLELGQIKKGPGRHRRVQVGPGQARSGAFRGQCFR
jgi:hypothetical protein